MAGRSGCQPNQEPGDEQVDLCENENGLLATIRSRHALAEELLRATVVWQKTGPPGLNRLLRRLRAERDFLSKVEYEHKFRLITTSSTEATLSFLHGRIIVQLGGNDENKKKKKKKKNLSNKKKKGKERKREKKRKKEKLFSIF